MTMRFLMANLGNLSIVSNAEGVWFGTYLGPCIVGRHLRLQYRLGFK